MRKNIFFAVGIIWAFFMPTYTMDPVIIPSDETIAKQVVISNLATHYAILPDDYQKCDVSIDPRFRYKTFNDLPKKFKEAIIKHYEAQEARKIQ